jgi:hypothetical protein
MQLSLHKNPGCLAAIMEPQGTRACELALEGTLQQCIQPVMTFERVCAHKQATQAAEVGVDIIYVFCA